MTPRVPAGVGTLTRLALRRVLPVAFVALVVALLALAATRDWSMPAFAARALQLAPDEVRALDDAAVRGAVWAVLAAVVLPVVIVRAASLARHWTTADADWFAPLPVARGWYSSTSLAGPWSAALLLVATTALAAEATVDGDGAALRFRERLPHPAFALVEGAQPVRWQQPELAGSGIGAGSRVLVTATVTGSRSALLDSDRTVPTAGVRITIDAGGGATSSVERNVTGRTTLALEVPRGPEVPTVSVERLGAGGIVVVPSRSVELCVAAASSRLASLELALRFLVTLVAWSAIAAGFGAWMRPSLAATLAIAMLLLACRIGEPLGALPGATLPNAWSLVSDARVPPGLSVVDVGGALALTAVGAVVFHVGLGRGRTGV